MKKIVVALIIFVIWISPASADTYYSTLGFSIDIPSHWLIMSRQEVKDNPDLFNFEAKVFKKANKAMLEQVKKQVLSGDVEIYFNQNTSDSFLADNINVYKTVGRLPGNVAEMDKICKQLPNLLSKAYGRPVTVYECGFREVGGTNAYYVDFDGVVDGTRSIQYQVPKSSSVTIVLTATCKKQSLEIIRREFEDMMSSFELK